MTIPPALLEEIRARIPLSDIVGRRLRLVRAGREWKAPCPFHAEKTPSFYVNDQKSFFHCFGCGAHGDSVGFLMRHDGLAFPEAVEQLAGLAGLEMPKPEAGEPEKYDRLKRLAAALEAAAKWFEAQLYAGAGRDALSYLRGRGLDDRTIAEFRLGYAPPGSDALRAALSAAGHAEDALEEVGLIRRPDDGRAPYAFFRNRVIFPVSDKRGRIVAFGGRILDGDGPKYVNSPEHALFHKGSILYGLARARTAIAKGERPVVVEGYMDVIALQTAGIGGAVAPLGTALGEAQLAELWKAQDAAAARDAPPILCFDGDEAGRRAAVRAVDRIMPLVGPARSVAVAFLPKGEDPDSLVRQSGGAEARRVLDAALPLIDAVWEFASAGRAVATPEQQAALWAELQRQIGSIADSQVASLYRTELRRRFDDRFRPQRAAGWRPGAWGGRGKPLAALGPKPRQVRPASVLEARIMLAMMINHPFLFDEFSEIFAEIELPVAWEQLRRVLFDALMTETLDAERLCIHLKQSGHGPLLDDILGPATLQHASFVKPGMSADQVRSGWRDVWSRSNSRMRRKELTAALMDPNRGDDRALERNYKLVEWRLDGLDQAEHPGTEGGFDHDDFVARAIAQALQPGSRQVDTQGAESDP